MVPANVEALARAISIHYTGKDEGAIAHVSVAAAFVAQLSKLGWHIAPGDGVVADAPADPAA